jgi:dynein heavy chain
MASLPGGFTEDELEERILSIGGYEQPLNIFLYQEVQRLQATITKVCTTLALTAQAIRGEVVVTAEIMRNIDALFNARVPLNWLYSPAGDELSWQAPNLGVWFGGLITREVQYKSWLARGRPSAFWLAGFFNPQGFLTAIQQEITRAHKQESWALDSMVLQSELTDIASVENVKGPPKEGAYIYGLFMDGAAWSASGGGTIVESTAKKLFASLPIIYVTALTKTAKRNAVNDFGPFGGYECPVYKYPVRTDRYLIFNVTLPSREQKPMHWVLRGVALLCATA